jgi:hypothetical protein
MLDAAIAACITTQVGGLATFSKIAALISSFPFCSTIVEEKAAD